MPQTKVYHSETWVLDITPADGETWPDSQEPAWRGRLALIRPDSIRVVVESDRGYWTGSIAGPAVLKSGKTGKVRGDIRLWGSAPDWAQQIIDGELARHGLEGKVTGRS